MTISSSSDIVGWLCWMQKFTNGLLQHVNLAVGTGMMVAGLKQVGTTAWAVEMLKMSERTFVSFPAQTLMAWPRILSSFCSFMGTCCGKGLFHIIYSLMPNLVTKGEGCFSSPAHYLPCQIMHRSLVHLIGMDALLQSLYVCAVSEEAIHSFIHSVIVFCFSSLPCDRLVLHCNDFPSTWCQVSPFSWKQTCSSSLFFAGIYTLKPYKFQLTVLTKIQ